MLVVHSYIRATQQHRSKHVENKASTGDLTVICSTCSYLAEHACSDVYASHKYLALCGRTHSALVPGAETLHLHEVAC